MSPPNETGACVSPLEHNKDHGYGSGCYEAAVQSRTPTDSRRVRTLIGWRSHSSAARGERAKRDDDAASMGVQLAALACRTSGRGIKSQPFRGLNNLTRMPRGTSHHRGAGRRRRRSRRRWRERVNCFSRLFFCLQLLKCHSGRGKQHRHVADSMAGRSTKRFCVGEEVSITIQSA